MAAPKYKVYPAEHVSEKEDPKTSKILVEKYIARINDTLKQPGMAKKAALIIENLINKKP